MDFAKGLVLVKQDLALKTNYLGLLTEREIMFELVKEAVIRPYEAIIVMDPNCSEEEQKGLFGRNQKIIEGFAGKINHIDTWGVRRLANPIEKTNRGIYFHCTFTAGPDSIAELERTMRINEKVLRFMHTRLPDETVLPEFVEKFKASLIERKEREAKRLAAKPKRPMR